MPVNRKSLIIDSGHFSDECVYLLGRKLGIDVYNSSLVTRIIASRLRVLEEENGRLKTIEMVLQRIVAGYSRNAFNRKLALRASYPLHWVGIIAKI